MSTGRSVPVLRTQNSERLLFPLAVIQISVKSTKRQAGNGQKQTITQVFCLPKNVTPPPALAVKSETALLRVVRMQNSVGDAFVGGWKVRRNSSSLIIVASGFFDIVVTQSADNQLSNDGGL